MGFTSDYAVLIRHIKLHLKIFAQTPQGTSFIKLIGKWGKTYGYVHKFTKIHFDQLITNVTIDNDKRRQAPGYKKADNIINGRTPEVPPPHPTP